MENIMDWIENWRNQARIFIIVKPGFFKLANTIIRRFQDDGWEVEKSRTKQLLLTEAHQLYKIHKKEDWYKPLCEYMASEPTTAFILVKRTERMSDKVFEETGKIKDEIREKYGESDMRNVMHSSDSREHMEQESSIYF